jgi:hypothetical protein
MAIVLAAAAREWRKQHTSAWCMDSAGDHERAGESHNNTPRANVSNNNNSAKANPRAMRCHLHIIFRLACRAALYPIAPCVFTIPSYLCESAALLRPADRRQLYHDFLDVDVGVGDAYMCLVVHQVAGRFVCDM